MSQIETLQARRPCAESLETFTQFFLHHAQLEAHGPERGSRFSLSILNPSLLAVNFVSSNILTKELVF